MLQLLYDPEPQHQAFVDACAWAEDIYICLAWIEPGDAQGPSFADLKPHEGKLRQAIVGLANFQSDPALLRRLHQSSVLRLVSTVDGSFSPNCYLFRNERRVRVLLASAPFTSTRFARSCESFVLFEGDQDDPFALQAFRLLERCRASAHVPTEFEIDAYEDKWSEAKTGSRTPEEIAWLALETYNGASLGELELEGSPTAVFEAFVNVRESLAAAAAVRVAGGLVPRWGLRQQDAVLTTLYWSSLGVWGALHRFDACYGLHFGFMPPWDVARRVAALSLVAVRSPLALRELVTDCTMDTMAIARADDGRRFLLFFAPDARDQAGDINVRDVSGAARADLIGEVGAAGFLQTAAAFALRVSRRRTFRNTESSS
jgi:hypothetical protein